jgi:hypothetical protein
MAVVAKYVDPLQVLETREVRDRIAAIAEREQVSQASVIRDLIAAGLDERERRSEVPA